jgi:hypothetical protein
MKPILPLTLLLSLLTALLVTGCTRTAEKKAESEINKVLPRYIGPANEWKTRIKGDSMGAVMRGRIRSVQIDGKGVRVSPDLPLEDMHLEFDEVEVDTKAGRLKSIGSASFTCRVRDVILDRYCRQLRKDINGLEVRFDSDNILVSAKPDALGIIQVPVTVGGKLVPQGESKLLFSPNQAKVSIVPVPEPVVDYLVGKLNPTIDLSHLIVPLRVQRANVEGKFLTISGTIAPDDILRLAP